MLLDPIKAEIGGSGEFSRDRAQANDLLKACQNLLILEVSTFSGLHIFPCMSETVACLQTGRTSQRAACWRLLGLNRASGMVL